MVIGYPSPDGRARLRVCGLSPRQSESIGFDQKPFASRHSPFRPVHSACHVRPASFREVRSLEFQWKKQRCLLPPTARRASGRRRLFAWVQGEPHSCFAGQCKTNFDCNSFATKTICSPGLLQEDMRRSRLAKFGATHEKRRHAGTSPPDASWGSLPDHVRQGFPGS